MIAKIESIAGLSQDFAQLRPRYDAVVVGSGYGGGVAAARLARAGLRVCVIERGREVPTGSFPARFSDISREFQVSGPRGRTGSPTGLYDMRLGPDMHVLVGCGLGGGSLINAGVALRPDPRVFADPVWPGQILQDGLIEAGFARARAWLRPAHNPAHAGLDRYKALHAASRALGTDPVNPELAVSFADTVNAAGVAQPACTQCGDCCAGCNVGAKTTVALTYLPEAARHGAHLVSEARVEHVRRGADGMWQVTVTPVAAKAGAGDAATPCTVTAPLVILAAGTLGTSEILLRSAAAGLRLSERLGAGFSANGDIVAFGYGSRLPVNAIGVGHPPKVEGLLVGAAVNGQIEVRDADCLDNEMVVQEGALPSAFAPALPVMFVPNGRLLGALQSLIAGVYKGPFQGLQTFFAVSHDAAQGRLALEGDRLALAWPGAADAPVYARLDATLTALAEKVGAAYVRNPLAGTLMGRQPATAHPLGGCGMGRDADSGVVDHMGRVFDGAGPPGSAGVHEGLYVMDGSVIPRSLGVNPLLTITALAERAMLHLLAERGLPSTDTASAT